MGTIRPGYISTQGFSALNLTQGHKPSYTTSYILIPNDGDNPTWLYINTEFHCFNATQGHKPSYPTSYISIPNYGDNPTWVFINKGFQCFNASLKDTNLAIQQTIYRSQIKKDYLPEYKLQGFRSTLTQ